ncbi:MAG: hypothetical protein HQM06_11740 [Magnetococcales bacterium]|nr:hypothetical protein [Magnetococcales bacterium]
MRLEGCNWGDPIVAQKERHGPLPELIPQLEALLKAHIRIKTDITSALTEICRPDYPLAALQQLLRNAIMHRDYHSSHADQMAHHFQHFRVTLHSLIEASLTNSL